MVGSFPGQIEVILAAGAQCEIHLGMELHANTDPSYLRRVTPRRFARFAVLFSRVDLTVEMRCGLVVDRPWDSPEAKVEPRSQSIRSLAEVGAKM